MKISHTLTAAAGSLALLAVTACGSGDDNGESSPGDDDNGNGGYGAPETDDDDSDDEATEVELRTEDTELGTVVVDGEGMVLYQFDSDEQGSGTSTCEDQCAENWPAVPGDEMVDVDGVTGDVDTITGVDGEPQLTLNGWPLYYFAADEAPGDVSGQGDGDIWWVLDPDGEPIRD